MQTYLDKYLVYLWPMFFFVFFGRIIPNFITVTNLEATIIASLCIVWKNVRIQNR
jgi:hypothetical protein